MFRMLMEIFKTCLIHFNFPLAWSRCWRIFWNTNGNSW